MSGEASLEAQSHEELESREQGLRERMRPLERELADLRAEREQVLTELRRRERLQRRERRAGLKEAMRSGSLPTLAELVESGGEGAFDSYAFTLKTGGEVRLGFPGARSQSVSWTDGRQVAQARSLDESRRYYEAGWEMGAPGKPGVRVYFPGTRLERLVEAAEVFARSV